MPDLAARLSRLSPQERQLLEQRLAAKARRPASGLVRRLPGEVAPLSFSQRRVWYLEQLNPGTATYNAPNAFRGKGCIDVQAFRKAVNLVLERHSVLRTAIIVTDRGEPHNQVADQWDAVEIVEAANEQQALERIRVSAKKPFDLARDLMLRALLVSFGMDDFAVVFTSHHIAWDGVSKGIFYREVGSIYDALVAGDAPTLAPLAVEYADYALWQERTFSGEKREKEIAYWKQQLGGAPPYLDIPLDKPRPAVQRFQGAKIPFQLSANLLDDARVLSRLERTTLYVTLLAVFKVFLLAFTGQQDICVATPFAGRDEEPTQQLIGFFINTVILRTRLSASLSFREVIRRVRESVLGAQEHQLMPMDMLMEILQAPRDLSRMPLAQVNFRLQGGAPPEWRLRGMELTPLPLIDTSISKFDMALEVASVEGESGYVEYNSDLFAEQRMARIPEMYRALLADLIAAPDVPLETAPSFKAIGDLSPKRRRIALPMSTSRIRATVHA